MSSERGLPVSVADRGPSALFHGLDLEVKIAHMQDAEG